MVALIITFIVLIVVMFLILVASLNKILNRDVGQATAHLDQLSNEYAKKEQDIKKQLEDVKRQGQEVIANAQKDAEQYKQRVMQEAQAQKEKIIADTTAKTDEMIQQADRARKALLDEINSKIDEKAAERALELLEKALPENIKLKLHQSWIDDLMASTYAQLERLHIPQGTTEANVVVAFPLTDGQREELKNKVKEKLGFQVFLKENVDPSIIAGWVVTIGDLVLDGSLRFKIHEMVISQQQ